MMGELLLAISTVVMVEILRAAWLALPEFAIKISAGMLAPEVDSARWKEEWLYELNQNTSQLRKLAFAFGTFSSVYYTWIESNSIQALVESNLIQALTSIEIPPLPTKWTRKSSHAWLETILNAYRHGQIDTCELLSYANDPKVPSYIAADLKVAARFNLDEILGHRRRWIFKVSYSHVAKFLPRIEF